MNNRILTKKNVIWNWLTTILSERNNIEEWSIILEYRGALFEIYPIESKQTRKIIKTHENYFNTLGISREKTDPEIIGGKLIIPISILDKNLFYIRINNDYDKLESDTIKLVIESILFFESLKLREYPSFLPFFLPLDESEISNINESLSRKKEIFFLNGMNGTGKHTFIRNHILYCYNESVDIYKIKDFEYGKITKIYLNNMQTEVFIINELALLSEQDQKNIVNEINLNKKNKIIFICSAYDPLILSKKGVITLELEKYCVENRVRFPSLSRRSNHLLENISFYFYCKGKSIPFFINKEWLINHQFTEGFDELFKFFEKYYLNQSSIHNIFENEGNIRDAVSELELNGIIYAKKIIGNSQNKIAKFLGISRGSLQHKLKKYQIPYTDWEE